MGVIKGETLILEVDKEIEGKLNIVSGKSIQNGVPSLTNPIVIENIGEGGYIELKITNDRTLREEIIQFPLGANTILHEGDYLAEDGIHHTRETYTYDSAGNWKSAGYKDNGAIYNYFRDKRATNPETHSMRKLCFCSHLPIKTEENAGMIDTISWDGSKLDFDLLSSDGMLTTIQQSIADWGTWVEKQYENGTPVIIEYEITSEYIESYNHTQELAYAAMQQIILGKGKNKITSTNELKPILELSYPEENTDFIITKDGYLKIPQLDKRYLVNMSESIIPSMPEATESTVRIAGRDGDMVLNTTYEPISLEIICYTEQNLTPEEKAIEESQLKKVINSMKHKTRKFIIEKDNKFYNVKYNGAMVTTNYPTHLQFSIPMKSSSSYAMELEEKKIIGNNSTESNTIKDVGAMFTIEGPAQSPKISLNNYIMEYSNDILRNSRLVINSKNSTATLINDITGLKSNAMRYYNHQFPKIENGLNTLAVLSGIDNENQVDVKWYDLKL